MDTLASKFPERAKLWHPTKNGSLTPWDVSPSGKTKVWWICPKCSESYEATLNSHSGGRRCPYCVGKKISNNNSLAFKFPELAKTWHPIRNGSLTPELIAPHSHKLAWWVCSKGHEWEAVINSRSSNGATCPYCSGHKLTTSFADRCPELVFEWHPTKNKLKPTEVAPNAHYKIWWICSEGHEWESVVSNRTKGSGCPYCCGNLPTTENNLAVVNPALAAEWHPTKNGELRPEQVTKSANKLVWWICPHCGNEWQATVNNRARGHNCGRCNPLAGTSIPEIRLWSELATIFGEENVLHRCMDCGTEFDIFIKPLNIAIEYDGLRWHEKEEVTERDTKKYSTAKTLGITFIKVSELIDIPADRVFLGKKITWPLMQQIVKFLWNFDYAGQDSIKSYLQTGALIGEELFKKKLSTIMHKELFANDVCLDFDEEKNYPLKLYNFSKWSKEKVWWKCRLCGNSWKSPIECRVKRQREECSYCVQFKRSEVV